MEKEKASDSLFHLPGWYWYLEGDKDISLLGDNEQIQNFIDLCLRVFYQDFRIMGYHEFESKCLKILNNPIEYEKEKISYVPFLKYFYNRQPFIQMTQKPFSTRKVHVTIPIQRKAQNEIQMDILQLNQHFFKINFHVKYLIVAVEIYSRFVWVYPVKALDVNTVTNGLLRAFSRPGISHAYFEKLRTNLRTITVDGGSEFKNSFPTSMKQIFPNSVLTVAPPKSKTYGRPTLTGPIEASIRTLRKLLRDYGLRNQANILEKNNNEAQAGLSQIIIASNDMPRKVLNGNTPSMIAQSIIDTQPIENVENKMKEYRKKQFLKKVTLQTKEFPIILSNQEMYVYRLYLPQKEFAKEVDFRVSLKTYFILQYTSKKVNICNCEDVNDTMQTTWQSLVLVKQPFHKSVVPYYEQLKKFYNQEETENDVEMVPLDLMEPYEISNVIKDSMSGNKVLEVHPGRLLRRSPRLQK